MSKGQLKVSKKLREGLETLLDEHEEQGNKESFVVSEWEIVGGNNGDDNGSTVEKQEELEKLELKIILS